MSKAIKINFQVKIMIPSKNKKKSKKKKELDLQLFKFPIIIKKNSYRPVTKIKINPNLLGFLNSKAQVYLLLSLLENNLRI
jgi:hypothetical protein